MNLRCVTVCVDCDDYLHKCVSNAVHLDAWVIVTNVKDKKTVELCRSYGIDYILTNTMYNEGRAFAKGRAVNDGIAAVIQPECWLLQLDCDIKLPEDFRHRLNTTSLENNTLYGCHRYDLTGVKVLERSDDGETVLEPPGYFHLWSSTHCESYPQSSSNAKQDDSDHIKNFNRWDFLDIPVTHVNDELKINHYGRGPVGKSRHKLFND